jgi:hypothetical protein
MNILEVIKQLQRIADTEPTIEVWCHDGYQDASELRPVDSIEIALAWTVSNPTVRVVEIGS